MRICDTKIINPVFLLRFFSNRHDKSNAFEVRRIPCKWNHNLESRNGTPCVSYTDVSRMNDDEWFWMDTLDISNAWQPLRDLFLMSPSWSLFTETFATIATWSSDYPKVNILHVSIQLPRMIIDNVAVSVDRLWPQSTGKTFWLGLWKYKDGEVFLLPSWMWHNKVCKISNDALPNASLTKPGLTNSFCTADIYALLVVNDNGVWRPIVSCRPYNISSKSSHQNPSVVQPASSKN